MDIHPVTHAQCDKSLLRLLSIRKPETFCRRIVNTTIEGCQSVFMANLKKILTTLPAATLKKHSLGLRLTAFRRSFKIIQQLFRCGYSRGCMFTHVQLVLFTMVLIYYAL